MSDVRNGTGPTSSTDHLDSGRYLRWSMGYQDALYYLATEMYNMHQHKLNVKVFWLNTEESLAKKLPSKDTP